MAQPAKHTSGPWIVDNGVSEDITGRPTLGIYAAGPEEYGYVCGIHCGPDADITKQDYVNAHLIAAAPAMYEALLLAVQALEELAQHPAFEGEAEEFNAGGYGYIALNKAQTALAQADGKHV